MATFHIDYSEAFNAAVHLARSLQREVGLEAFKEYNTRGYRVFQLPKPELRFGFELRCQVVGPTEPLMMKKD